MKNNMTAAQLLWDKGLNQRACQGGNDLETQIDQD